MEIAVTITLDDIIRFYEFEIWDRQENVKLRLFSRLINGMLSSFMYIFLMPFIQFDTIKNIVGFAFLFCIFFIFGYLYGENRVKILIKIYCNQLHKNHKNFIGHGKYVFTKDTIYYEETVMKFEYKNQAISKVIETHDYFYIYMTDARVLIIPKKDLEKEGTSNFSFLIKGLYYIDADRR